MTAQNEPAGGNVEGRQVADTVVGCSHGPDCTLPWSAHDWDYEEEWERGRVLMILAVTRRTLRNDRGWA